MRDRRKRLKPAQASSVDPSPGLSLQCGNDSEETSSAGGQQLADSFPVDSSKFECGSSKCSVNLIHEVVSKFDSQKKDLVKSTGFEGILHLPAIKQFNRKFSLWLMTCVNERLATINIGQHICIRFNKFDVGHVIGIPSDGKTVLDALVGSRNAKDSAKDRVTQQFLGSEFEKYRNIKIVQEIIERNYPHPMCKEDADRFRVAFVVFVVSNMLCPSAKYDYASVDYWNAIQDPDAISTYDWSEFVITKLLKGVKKLKKDIAKNIKYPILTGCSVFLKGGSFRCQVLYLDSLHLKGLSLPHNTFPRVRDFSFHKIQSMILADNNYTRHIKADPDIPVGKLREEAKCVYSWASQHSVESRTGCQLAIWESAVAMVHLLNIPREAAGPVFVAAADFQEEIDSGQIDSGLLITGIQAIKFMIVLVSRMIPYFRYQSSYATSGGNTDNQVLESAIKSGISLMSFPIWDKWKKLSQLANGNCLNESMLAKNHQSSNSFLSCVDSSSDKVSLILNRTPVGVVATTVSQFYSFLRKLKPVNDFDLNACPSGSMCSPISSSVSAGVECDVLPSPWDLGYSWSLSDMNPEVLFERLRSMHDDKSLVIVHREPKYIQVSLCAMCAQFLGKCEMKQDLFDALIRIARQEDDLLFSSYGSLRWRHFFESDFMGVILSSPCDLVDSKLRDRLSLSNSSFDLSKCNLVFFPSLLEYQWVCFVWQQQKNVIYVFDPSHCGTLLGRRVELIERACYMLKLALMTLSQTVFTGVTKDVLSAEPCIMKLADTAVSRLNRSGVLCSLFYRCFDGCDLKPDFPKVDAEAVASKLFHQIRNLKQTQAHLLHSSNS